MVEQQCKVVRGGWRRGDDPVVLRRTVPQEAEVAAGAEEDVEEDVESEEHGQRRVQRGFSS